jgi:uncharacterized protein
VGLFCGCILCDNAGSLGEAGVDRHKILKGVAEDPRPARPRPCVVAGAARGVASGRQSDHGCVAGSSAMGDIWEAAKAGDLGEVERLVGHDPSLLDAKDGRGQTPLILSSEKGHVGVVRWLLDRGAALNERDDDGFTALYLASCYGRGPVVALLLERGADPTIANNGNTTPLAIASYHGRTEVVRYLLARPSAVATINRRSDRGGCTALWWACLQGQGGAVRLLLKHGADPTIADNDGTTPMANAQNAPFRVEGHRECIEALEVRGPLRALGPPLSNGPG